MKLEIETGISITLTQEQIDSIEAQKNPKLTANNIDYKSAKALLDKHYINPDFKNLYNGDLLKLITIICAVNFIDNGYKLWIPNFENTSQYKYYNWFEKTASGWLLGDGVSLRCSGSYVPGGFYFMKESSARVIANKHIDLYSQYLG